MSAPALPYTPTRIGLVLLLGIAVGASLALAWSWSSTPARDSVEAGFARDMASHHAQAVEMALIIRDASSDEALRTLAYDIVVTQGAQRGVFMGWLQEWGVPQTSVGSRMAWMPGHAGTTGGTDNGAPMHGMATDEELRRLQELRGAEADVLFLQLMIRHHEGGVIMANAVTGLTRRSGVLTMAKSVQDSQQAEIAAMTAMLAARGARPFPSLLE